MIQNLLNVKPITLNGQMVRLEPLGEQHIRDLTIAGSDSSIWQYMLYGQVTTTDKMRIWVRNLLELQELGTDVPFAVVLQENGKAIGGTRFMDIRPAHRGLEIGGTWYGVEYQHTRVNTECKFLLLEHAFEKLGCIRVQLKTDSRNIRSQQAIERIGAIKEGTLRNHLITPEGVFRHTVYYSIIDIEWLAVKKNLIAKLTQFG